MLILIVGVSPSLPSIPLGFVGDGGVVVHRELIPPLLDLMVGRLAVEQSDLVSLPAVEKFVDFLNDIDQKDKIHFIQLIWL